MRLLPLILFIARFALAAQPGEQRGVDGVGSPTVAIPRSEAAVWIDGDLGEAVWQTAARLTGFSRYRPVEGGPADEKTEVLIWYSPTALHFGIIAYDSQPASIRATMADRDNLDRDDTVRIYLDTFGDRRRAFLFGVNPLGVQEDGVQTEGGFDPGRPRSEYAANLSPDYQFDSKGRLTSDGYTVEIRIPFKSLRYPGGGPQRWRLNILRKVQRTGHESTWTDARRTASFLAQAGAIEGLHDLERGVVTEIQPVATVMASSERAPSDATARRESLDVDPGVNLRLGFTSLSLDATVNPDFSQVEADAGLVTVNERFALYFPERRPFFLEGIELFSAPNQLVYTRQIVNPAAGGKLSGKVGRFGVASLVALDETATGRRLVHLTRVQRDLHADSVAGVTFTDRIGEGESNRVLAADTRIVFAKLYYVQAQIGRSWTADAGQQREAPVWLAEFDRTGHFWGFNYRLNALGEGFEARSGYVPRADVVDLHTVNRLSAYGPQGAFFESLNGTFNVDRVWHYRHFVRDRPVEGDEQVSLTFRFRGGWQAVSRVRRGFVRFEESSYSSYQVLRDDGLVDPYRPPAELRDAYTNMLSVSTPTFRRFNAQMEAEQGTVPLFPEASVGRERRITATATVRPAASTRVEATLTYSRLTRARDDSEFARTIIPRLKVEFQPRRSLLFRFVGEYWSERQAALQHAPTGQPLLIEGTQSVDRAGQTLRLDWLLSYRPSPGMIVFVGYGSNFDAVGTSSPGRLQRMRDALFVKVAYQFRY